MSLQLWLPLNGSDENRGLRTLGSTTNTASVNSSGKIGSCYSFNGSNSHISIIDPDKTFWNGKEISYACWFKSDQSKSSGTIIEIAADLCLAYNYTSSGLKFGFWRVYANSSGSRSGDEKFGSIYYDASVWHHLAISFDHAITKLYVDGTLSQTWDGSLMYTTNVTLLLGDYYNNIAIGRSYGSTSFIGGYVNDVRIYDHCLSGEEVKDIANGLIVHYPLSDPYVEPTTNLISIDKLSSQGGTLTKLSETYLGSSVYRDVVTNPSHYNNAGFNIGSNVITLSNPPSTATLSFWARVQVPYTQSIKGYVEYYLSDGTTSTQYRWNFDISDWSTSSSYIGVWRKITSQITIPSDAVGIEEFYVYGDMNTEGTCDYAAFQFELKDHATPYTSSSRTDTTVYDCAGYNHNAVVNTTQKPIVSTYGTPRYSKCTYFKRNIDESECTEDGGMYMTANDINLFSPEWTISVWMKPLDNGYQNGQFITIASNGLWENYISYGIATRDARIEINTIPIDESTTERTYNYLSLLYPVGYWAMTTYTFDGYTLKSYLNGVLQESVTVSSTTKHKLKYQNSTSGLALGYNYAGGCHRFFNGYMSDFRIYSTALSVDDIQDLYKTGASVCKNGTLKCYEIKED